jgi:hemoglobin/transferrin/lactoferrin receptor protein
VNTELTLGYTFNQYFRVEATGFYTRFFNAIVTDKFTYNGADTIVLDGKTGTVYANQNKRKADIFGVSARFHGRCNALVKFVCFSGLHQG